MQVAFCNMVFYSTVFFPSIFDYTLLYWFGCLIGGYLDPFKHFSIKNSVLEHTNENRENCLFHSQS